MAVLAGGPFERAGEVIARLAHAPAPAEAQAFGLSAEVPVARWSLRTIRAALDWLSGYSLSGGWRLLRRLTQRWRPVRQRPYSPDPAYEAKRDHLEACLRQVAQPSNQAVMLFLDEMGYRRWSTPSRNWMAAAPQPAQATEPDGTNGQWRIVGALNAWSGQVDYLDNYVIGRRQLVQFYAQLSERYADVERIYLVEDNWSVHQHPEVLAALAADARLQVIWLPTYAPWLNPIEKVWRWLRQLVLHDHHLAADPPQLRRAVRAFLNQFAAGSEALLAYVGLLGEGHLARARAGL